MPQSLAGVRARCSAKLTHPRPPAHHRQIVLWTCCLSLTAVPAEASAGQGYLQRETVSPRCRARAPARTMLWPRVGGRAKPPLLCLP